MYDTTTIRMSFELPVGVKHFRLYDAGYFDSTTSDECDVDESVYLSIDTYPAKPLNECMELWKFVVVPKVWR